MPMFSKSIRKRCDNNNNYYYYYRILIYIIKPIRIIINIGERGLTSTNYMLLELNYEKLHEIALR